MGEVVLETAQQAQEHDDGQPAELHRAFAREMDQRFGRVYGFGGGFVLLSVAAVLVGAFFLGWLSSPASWMVALSVGLIALFVVRTRVNQRRIALLGTVEQYCTVNELSIDNFKSYFDGQGLYPFLGALFEKRP